MQKEILLTPGPTSIPSRIFNAMNAATMHHRTDAFKQIFNEALQGLQWLLDADATPIFLASSGSGAMEAALVNTCQPGDKVVVMHAGIFGERWLKIAQRFELEVVSISAPYGESPELSQIEEVLRKNPDAKAFCVQYSETSTTALHPVGSYAALLRRSNPDCLFIVDAISALVTTPVSVKEFDIDILVGASQKALMLPPGLSFLALSTRAWQRVEKTKRRCFYWDLLSERDSHAKGTTAWTPAMNIILGLAESIRMLREEGIEKVYARHQELAQATRAGIAALGLQALAPRFPATGVSGAHTPAGMDADQLRGIMLKEFGVRIAGGQASLKGKIIRIGHMGYVSRCDILGALGALEFALGRMGIKSPAGAGAAAALAVFSRN
jgi:aspartate aminotransferase-like enzyme